MFRGEKKTQIEKINDNIIKLKKNCLELKDIYHYEDNATLSFIENYCPLLEKCKQLGVLEH